MKIPLKKDPEGMYSDLPIDPNEDLKGLDKNDLAKLADVMTDTDVRVDNDPRLEEVYETYGRIAR